MTFLGNTVGLDVSTSHSLVPADAILHEHPITTSASTTVAQGRAQIQDILSGASKRLLVIVGPCSIHDPQAALDYADKLYHAAQKYSDALCIVMRVYFEKPRTRIGWKGLINDPDLNGSFRINHGLSLARQLLLQINEIGLPCASEVVDMITPHYYADLLSWGAIGARTVQSPSHRELASSFAFPVGFKNTTDGNVQVAIDATVAVREPHHFLSMSPQGTAAIYASTGNPWAHIILRGSDSGPNFEQAHIVDVQQRLHRAKLEPHIMIDCSHGNSGKSALRQQEGIKQTIEYIHNHTQGILGVMLESHLEAGNQSIHQKPLKYGQSITDPCLSWEQTAPLLEQLANAVTVARPKMGHAE